MVEGGVQVAGVDLWARGRKAMWLPFGRIGEGFSPFPFVLDFPQDLHERLLLERLGALGVRVERPTELVRFAPGPDRVRCATTAWRPASGSGAPSCWGTRPTFTVRSGAKG